MNIVRIIVFATLLLVLQASEGYVFASLPIDESTRISRYLIGYAVDAMIVATLFAVFGYIQLQRVYVHAVSIILLTQLVSQV